MESFETLLKKEYRAVERFVRFRLHSQTDADDVLQETCITAYQKFSQLKDRSSFKAWLISIARNKCNDYFRKKAIQFTIPIEEISENLWLNGRHGIVEESVVLETLDLLSEKDKEILYLYFWREMPQAEIAEYLHIPLGTVKSRLHTAKQNFKYKYPYHTNMKKGESAMKKMPKMMPEYTLTHKNEPPFSVRWEELMGWFLIPRLGESLSWASYDIPSRKCWHIYDMEVLGKASVHGIEGVEIIAKETTFSEKSYALERTFVAQLTETHCRYLATTGNEASVRNYITFLDGEAFMTLWGYGENNCGNEIHLSPKGEIKRDGSVVSCPSKDFLLDVVGRYNITIGRKTYDTICVMDIISDHADAVIEQFLDKNGRTVLWRRYNRNDWAIDRYKKLWSEMLPENDRLEINGTSYVHWYDCITEYIL